MIRNKSMKRVSLVSAVIAVGAMVLTTLPAQAATPGVTASEIKLGISSPTSGSAGTAYGKLPGAMKAYFSYINANGGVYGRKITLVHRDDKYLPVLAATKTTQLVLDDGVFALVGALGTATHTKAYKAASLAKENVPDLFVNTGYSGFGDTVKYPTTFTVLPSYAMEAKIMSKFIKENFAGQAVALIAQDDEFGIDGVNGFKAGGLTIASTTLYPQSSLTDARAKSLLTGLGALPGKPVLVMMGTTDVTATILKAAESLKLVSKFTWIAGSVGGDANTLVGGFKVEPATINGMLAASFFPDAKDTKDEYVSQFMKINTKYNKGVTFDNVVLQGMNSAMLTVQALRAAGKNLTREGLISAIENKGSKFAGAALVPLNYSTTSRVGYNGYWFGQLNASGELKPFGGKLSIFTTDSGDGAIQASNFKRPTMPKNGIPTNS
jgi:ABC-type branched-subunit amino acid transport system substrate-binding protein